MKAMKIKLNGRSWFPQVTSLLTFYLLLAIICCWYITGLSLKITFTNTAFITLGSKCYYGWDFYYTWVQLLQLCLLQDGLYNALFIANDPCPVNFVSCSSVAKPLGDWIPSMARIFLSVSSSLDFWNSCGCPFSLSEN